jgi:hypothetical protein
MAGKVAKPGFIHKVQTCEFVSSSEVFAELPLAKEIFANSEPDCTWGDTNRSLVTPDVISSVLEDADTETPAERKQVKEAIKRLYSLGQTYIDLES